MFIEILSRREINQLMYDDHEIHCGMNINLKWTEKFHFPSLLKFADKCTNEVKIERSQTREIWYELASNWRVLTAIDVRAMFRGTHKIPSILPPNIVVLFFAILLSDFY